MKNKLLFSFAALLLSAVAAHADSVSLILDGPAQTTAGGTTLSYSGTITAALTNTGTIYLNGDDFTFTGPYSIDDSPFITNFVFGNYALAPGDSDTDVLFNIAVPLDSPITTFTGTFTVLGGSTDSSQDPIASAAFSTTVTPEPSSFLLLGTGVACFAAAMVTRRRKVRMSATEPVALA